MTYSIIGILAAVILLITNRDVLWGHDSREQTATERCYRRFLLGVLCYYITDALWGILEAAHLIPLLFADTSLYFAAMAAAVLLWTRYVIAYLENTNRFSTFLYHTGNIFFVFELVVVLINFFRPVLFWFDAQGAYHAGPLRYVTLAVQILMFLLTSVYTLRITSRTEGRTRRRHRTIGLFGIAMILLILVQIRYPLLPLYAIGYMLGTCLLHSFVVEDEKEENRRELNEALLEAEKANRAKTVFLNNMSHDIRTPMNAIVGFTGLAASHVDDPEKVKKYLDMISVSSGHLLSLINDVLDMSRIESGKMILEETEIHLPDMVREIRTILQAEAEAKHLTLLFDTENMVNEDICADRLRINQVLLNILNNAVKFTPEGGTVSFRMTETPAADPDHTMLEFRVKDTGIGMNEEFQKTIFEAFTREQTTTVSGIQGTGLGMTITKSIVDMMDGTISVRSKPGEGSEFTVVIPCRISGASGNTESDAAGLPGKKESEKPDFTGKHILLAEDNMMNQMIAEAILKDAGFTLDIAHDGAQAVERIEEAPAGTYDAVLMDIQMPNMDGYEAAGRIRALEDQKKASIPIIAVTANAFEEDRQLALEAGMNAHLVKPYDVPKMMEVLQELLL